MGRGWYDRRNTKTSTEDLLCIRLADLQKLKCLTPGRSGGLQWIREGEKIASIRFTVADSFIRFRYVVGDKGDNQITVDETIPFTLTPCNYGGHRRWFCCNCGRKVATMFIHRQTIACRHCFNAVYPSQREDKILRYWRKINKLEDKLKDNHYRPKGMHIKTFEWINDEWVRLNVEREELFGLEYDRRFTGKEKWL